MGFKKMTFCGTRPSKKAAFAATLSILGCLCAAPSHATTVSYLLSVNDPIFNSQNGNFNVPDIRLENTSTRPGVSITDFQLSIGDTAFNYDFVRNQAVVIDTNNDLTPTLNTVGTRNDRTGDDILDYSFTGFDPGDVFQFEVDIDPDGPGSVTQDFRNILFPAATAFVTFSDGSTRGNTIDPADPTSTSFIFTQNLPTTIAPIPLPGGLPLMLGALGLGAVALRRPRQKTNALSAQI
ncbi:MAG: hypothetical protein AAFP98_08500 [Pseudomonadota bacterium]